ncbi:unnamed protein product [Mucor hiemalis]
MSGIHTNSGGGDKKLLLPRRNKSKLLVITTEETFLAQAVDFIWKDWMTSLNNKDVIKKFHPYSPEFHHVIRLGHNVSWKPNLDQDLYTKHLENMKNQEFPLPSLIAEYLNLVVDSSSLEEYETATYIQISKTSTLKMVNAHLTTFSSINEDPSSGAIFKVGETPLQAMKKQINDSDESSLYYADGIINFSKVKKLEVLLLETSSSFGSSDKTKSPFEHKRAESA